MLELVRRLERRPEDLPRARSRWVPEPVHAGRPAQRGELCNMPRCIEHNVEWLATLLHDMRSAGQTACARHPTRKTSGPTRSSRPRSGCSSRRSTRGSPAHDRRATGEPGERCCSTPGASRVPGTMPRRRRRRLRGLRPHVAHVAPVGSRLQLLHEGAAERHRYARPRRDAPSCRVIARVLEHRADSGGKSSGASPPSSREPRTLRLHAGSALGLVASVRHDDERDAGGEALMTVP